MLRAGGVPDEQVARARLKPAKRVNENPGCMTVAGLRYLMKHHPWTRELDLPRRRRARDASFVEARRRGWFAQPFIGVDADHAERIAARYADDNESFAQLHWQRSWDEVFADDVARRWVSNEVDPDAAPRTSSTTWPRTRTNSSPRPGCAARTTSASERGPQSAPRSAASTAWPRGERR